MTPDPHYPFLQPNFLDLLERSGSVGSDSGWQPCHLHSGEAFLPLYQKQHSWGEYVFDWQWAEAYHRHGLHYYPKLLTAIPFTPCSGPRWRGSDQQFLQLAEQAIAAVGENGCSGWHLLFPFQNDVALLQEAGMMIRQGIQYHWHNRGYGEFDDFLAALSSRKRKQIKRERRDVADSQFQIKRHYHNDLGREQWQEFFLYYHRTYLKRSGATGYLTEAFFTGLPELGDNHCLVTAELNGEWVAAALFFYDNTTLYGRYWGCRDEYQFLHFELCYYQAIEIAIARGLQRIDAGAQGQHKIARGFIPVRTWSGHWLAHTGFRDAIGDFLRREQQHVAAEFDALMTQSPYRTAD